MDVADFAKLLGTDLGALAMITALWAFVAKDGASVRTRISVLGGIGVVIFVVGLAVWPRSEDQGVRGLSTTRTTPPTPAEPTGQIISPVSGERVGRDSEARGILANIPEDQHVWAVVRDGNLLYPQDSEVTPPDGEWSLSFLQGGETKVTSLELYRMGGEGHRFINDRLNAGDLSGISRIPGAVRLDAVENLRIRGLSTDEVEGDPTGHIVSPASGDSVGRDIEARGTLASIPEDEHVWLVVRDGNLLYPQDSELTPPDGEWSLSFYQGGETKEISLELYRMSGEGHRFINDRLNAGDFSGISRIPRAVRLDAVENLRIRG